MKRIRKKKRYEKIKRNEEEDVDKEKLIKI